MIKQVLVHCFLICASFSLQAQKDSSSHSIYDFGDFGGVVLMDSIVVSATRTGFDVQDFIKIVREDESFYSAFRNMRTRSYSSDNEIIMFSNKGTQKAKFYSQIKQYSDDTCRTMEVLNETVTGNFYKKKHKLRYYTAKLFDQLFFTHGKVCETGSSDDPPAPKKNMEKHISELKKLIFSPGEKADIPLIGKKTEIFSEKMEKYYDFSISSEKYNEGIDCYVFAAVIKPEYQTKKEDKTVIKSLYTYFDKSNFQVVARTYQLKYYGTLFDFNVNMKIELRKFGELYVPEYLEYDGFWDIPAKKPEIAKFHARFYDYK
ncbi:MAG: hypothetical protein ACI8P3_003093 [Saprospiraceae bacterium]|jgi:hypothetical protein